MVEGLTEITEITGLTGLTRLTPEDIEEEFSDLGPEHIKVCGALRAPRAAIAHEIYDKLWASMDIRMVRLKIGYTFGYARDVQMAFWYKTGDRTLNVSSPASESCLLKALIDFQLHLSYNEAGCSCNDCAETKLAMLGRAAGTDTFSSMLEFRNMIRDSLAPETPLMEMKTTYFGEGEDETDIEGI